MLRSSRSTSLCGVKAILRVVAIATLPILAACARPSPSRLGAAPAVRDAGAIRACFLLHELGAGQIARAPSELCAVRVTPASTYKIAHALAALDAGVLSGPDAVLHYQPGDYAFETWKRDHTLATAMRYSVVWYFQRVAEMLGEQRERDYLARFGYGNRDPSSGLTTFWLDGSLRVSPDEQMAFVVALYEDRIAVSREAARSVRRMLVQPEGRVVNALGEHAFAQPWPPGTVVSAKTGRGDREAWLVGHVQRAGRAWVFVSCVSGDDLPGRAAIDLAAQGLRSRGVL
jgi:beta-lactamase class D